MKGLIKGIGGLIVIFGGILLIGGGTDWIGNKSREFLASVFGTETQGYLMILLLVIAIAIACALLIPFLLLFTTRWVKPIVFISFKHVHEDKAIELETVLQKRGFGTERLAFSPNYTHDEVVSEVRKKIRKSHVVVTIPDAEKASFVDAELLAASTIGLPIVIIQYQSIQAQPGTLLQGYPVFSHQCVKEKKYDPLLRFFVFASRSYKGFWQQVLRIYRQMFDSSVILGSSLIIGMFVLLKLGYQLVHWVLADLLEWRIGELVNFKDDGIHTIIIMVILGGTLILIVKAFYLLRVARQSIVTGKESYKTFSEEFSYLKKDKEMMSCINENSLKAKA